MPGESAPAGEAGVTGHPVAAWDAAEALATAGLGVLALDRDWRVVFVNAEAARALSCDPVHTVGADLWSTFPGLTDRAVAEVLRRAMVDATPGQLDEHRADIDAWFSVRVEPAPFGVTAWFVDITAARQAQHRAEESVERTQELVELSAQVGDALAGSVQVQDVLRVLTRMPVPRLADWTLVTLIDSGYDNGNPVQALRNAASWHREPSLRELVHQFGVTRYDSMTGDAEVVRVAQSRELTAFTNVVDLVEGRLAPGPLALLQQLAPYHAVVVPLVANDTVSGTLTLLRSADRPALDAAEMTAARSIARRGAMGLDNAHLLAEHRRAAARLHDANQRLQEAAGHSRSAARVLQEALLTRLPEPDHLELRARYLPAVAGAQVGGDWYDALILPDGCTALMIGDVAGHDISAAALMGQMRGLLRAFTWDRRDPPALIVDRFERALTGVGLSGMASLILARIEQDEADQEQGVRRLVWTNAGHPPPVVLNPDGSTTVLTSAPQLLVGVRVGARRSDHEHVLPPGSTLLLYTDGLIENRTADLDVGIERLRDALSRHHDLPLAELLEILPAELAAEHEDDVALLAVRAHLEDRPRPAEAGPNRDNPHTA